MFIRSADPKGSPCASDGTLGLVRPFFNADRPAVRAGRMKTVYGFPLPDDPRGKEIHMATKYYIEDKNGTILSEDGTRKFIVLEGQKLHDYLQTEEGKQKRFFVYEDMLLCQYFAQTKMSKNRTKRGTGWTGGAV